MKYTTPVAELVALEAVSVIMASTETEAPAVTTTLCPNEGEEDE